MGGTFVNEFVKNIGVLCVTSAGRSPESKDLRTEMTANITTVRRSFDSLRSLRMTYGRQWYHNYS